MDFHDIHKVYTKLSQNLYKSYYKIIENRSKRSEVHRNASRSPAREDREDRDDAPSMLERNETRASPSPKSLGSSSDRRVVHE